MEPQVFDLDSAMFNREREPIPAPGETVFPSRGDRYVGCPQSSDRKTLLAPMSTPKQAVPGSAMPGVPWKSINPAPTQRRGLRG
jgi:hypothetical protein